MAFNGAGVYSRVMRWVTDRNDGLTIQASRVDTETDDIATALSLTICKDGQSTPTANIPLGGFKLTNVGDATNATDAVNRQTGDARYVVQTTFAVPAEVSVTSAATADILAAASARVLITGSTGPITSFGTGANRIRFVRFDSTPTLTHNATSLILPGAANITAAAGDTCIVVSDGSSNARVISYERASNGPFGTGDTPQFAGLNIGHATDTTITRSSAGVIAVEGVDVALNSTTRIHTVQQVEVGHASDTTITRASAGDIAVEGNTVYRAGGTDVAIADGGTGASTAAAAFTALKQTATDGSTGVLEIATAAEYRNKTTGALALTPEKVWDAADEVTLTDAATISVDLNSGINFVVTLAGNRTLGSPSNEKVGQCGVIRIVQDATGSRTLAYGTDWEFAGGTAPVLSTTAAAQDLLFYHVIATDRIFASLVKGIS